MKIRSTRALRRVMVMGAVVALAGVLMAPAASSETNGDNGESSSASLDPVGVDVPGVQAESVSGEATGCHTEIELNVDPSVLAQPLDVAAASDFTASAFEAIPTTGGLGYLGQLLDAVQSKIEAQIHSADDGSNGGVEVFHEEAGPAPEVELPWQGGGPITDKEDDCSLDLFGLTEAVTGIPPLAQDLQVESEGLIGQAGYAHTEATSQDNVGLIYTADQVDTECLATLAGIDAKTTIDDGEFLDVEESIAQNTDVIDDIPDHPDKNEELVDFEFKDVNPADPNDFFNFEFSLTANEQKKTETAVDVTGLHASLQFSLTIDGVQLFNLSVDGIRDQSHCDIHPVGTAIEVEPKFTG